MPIPTMIDFPTVLIDGCFYIKLNATNIIMLLGDSGSPITSFLPGWTPTGLYTGFSPLYLLEFQHESGDRATWFLDNTMRRHGDQVDRLPEQILNTLKEKAIPIIQKLVSTILCDEVPQIDLLLREFLKINLNTRRKIASLCGEALLPKPGYINSATVNSPLPLRSSRGDRSLTFDAAAISRCLSEDFQVKAIRAMAKGFMTWASPIDMGECPCVGGFFISDFIFCYRFYDRRNNIVFYVNVSEHYSHAFSVYIPLFDKLMCTPSGLSSTNLFFPNIHSLLTMHIIRYAKSLALTFGARPTRFVACVRGRPGAHIGHQLWNDLTGLEAAHNELPKNRLPEVIVLTADQGTEIYGPIDELFPAYFGNINRNISNVSDLIDYAYAERVFLCRLTGDRITTSLRNAIRNLVHASSIPDTIRERLQASNGYRRPIIIIGLRVENRTHIDLVGFFSDVMGSIRHVFPDAVVVLDGHNARDGASPGSMIDSHLEHRATKPPVAVEQDIAAALEAYGRSLGLIVINNIGMPVAASLAWCDAATGFIALWGAGLAKYRWVANLPGFILSSQVNLEQRVDFDIYNAPRYMEDPVPIVRANPAFVQDLPEAPMLVPVPGNPSYANFTVSINEIQKQIVELLSTWRQHFKSESAPK